VSMPNMGALNPFMPRGQKEREVTIARLAASSETRRPTSARHGEMVARRSGGRSRTESFSSMRSTRSPEGCVHVGAGRVPRRGATRPAPDRRGTAREHTLWVVRTDHVLFIGRRRSTSPNRPTSSPSFRGGSDPRRARTLGQEDFEPSCAIRTVRCSSSTPH